MAGPRFQLYFRCLVPSHSIAGSLLSGVALTLGSFLPPSTTLSPNTLSQLDWTVPPAPSSSHLSHNLPLPFQSRNYLWDFFSTSFSQRPGFFLNVMNSIARLCAVLQSGPICSASDRYLLKFLVFQWFISSADNVLSPYFYISLIVFAWNRKRRVVCLYSHFCLYVELTEPHSREARPRRVYQAQGVAQAKAQGLERTRYTKETADN